MQTTINEAICQLQDLKADRESFLDGENDEIYEADITAIETAIRVMQKTAWIPCSERLPEDGQDVIGCDKTGFITRYKFDADDPLCWIDDHEEFFMGSEIIAWMPLPEPYRKDEG